jgi:uncharacterized protein (TIGR02145 family)
VSVVEYPDAPVIIIDTLSAFRGMPVDLSKAVNYTPDMIFYENPDRTGRIEGTIVIYNPPKDDYYVTASNGSCEGPMGKIILQDPCPPDTADGEGNRYNVTSLVGLCWTDNLRPTTYTCSDEEIPFAKAYTCADCPDGLKEIFGLLYDWYSATNAEGTDPNCICPEGFRLPTRAEWNLLNRYATSQLRSEFYWLTPPAPGTDDFGFDARPAGWYNGVLERFQDLYGFAGWWAIDDIPGTETATSFIINYYCSEIKEEVRKKTDGLSVRCVLDWPE